MKKKLMYDGDTCKLVNLECTPSEFLIIETALSKMIRDKEVHKYDRKIAEKMLFTKLDFSEV